jgi:hypothetical protein
MSKRTGVCRDSVTSRVGGAEWPETAVACVGAFNVPIGPCVAAHANHTISTARSGQE